MIIQRRAIKLRQIDSATRIIHSLKMKLALLPPARKDRKREDNNDGEDSSLKRLRHPFEFKNPAIQKGRLATLPTEMLREVLSQVDLTGTDGLNLLLTSKFFYNTLILELYKETGKRLSWYPLFIGAMDGNLMTLRNCIDAGAPMDHQWNPLNSQLEDSCLLPWTRPLDVAVKYLHVEAVELLLSRGANVDVDLHVGMIGDIATKPYGKSDDVFRRWEQRRPQVPDREEQRQWAYYIRCDLIRADGGGSAYPEWPLVPVPVKFNRKKHIPYIEIEDCSGQSILIPGFRWCECDDIGPILPPWLSFWRLGWI